mmetsp:Transcript_102544/g.290000  ORF Transcript_102544/g.290000 Transcript_102544/m.290000 type:complete len:244 (-) Transcript_102544:393-1124(-)
MPRSRSGCPRPGSAAPALFSICKRRARRASVHLQGAWLTSRAHRVRWRRTTRGCGRQRLAWRTCAPGSAGPAGPLADHGPSARVRARAAGGRALALRPRPRRLLASRSSRRCRRCSTRAAGRSLRTATATAAPQPWRSCSALPACATATWSSWRISPPSPCPCRGRLGRCFRPQLCGRHRRPRQLRRRHLRRHWQHQWQGSRCVICWASPRRTRTRTVPLRPLPAPWRRRQRVRKRPTPLSSL